MSTIQPTTLTLSGHLSVRIVADTWGDPAYPAVVFFHGAGQTRHAWGRTARSVAEAGWYAVSVDLRGHGNSDWTAAEGYSLDHLAGDVRAVASSLECAAIIGASIGGLSALVAVGESDEPLTGSLVLVDITTRPERAGVDRIRDFMRRGMEGFSSIDEAADAVASYLPNRDRAPDHESLRKNLRRRGDGTWVFHWDPAFLDRTNADVDNDAPGGYTDAVRLEAAARRVTVPTLLVRGEVSDVVSGRSTAELEALLPNSRTAVVARAGHMVAGDRNDRFTDAVLEFLRETTAGAHDQKTE